MGRCFHAEASACFFVSHQSQKAPYFKSFIWSFGVTLLTKRKDIPIREDFARMKVLIVNTSEKTGGAAIAAARLRDALINNGVKAKMLVRTKESNNPTVVGLRPAWKTKWHFLAERFLIWTHNGFSREHLFDIDTATHGTDITKLPEFKEADVIHLHWINQGMLSLKNLRKILKSGKPMVWTMHDMWPFTGICHHARTCQGFITGCHDCDLLKHPGKHDLSTCVMQRKEQLFRGCNIYFIGCSQWLTNEAKQSRLFHNLSVTDIPNPLNTKVFSPSDKSAARKEVGLPENKTLILFSAYKTTTPAKGIQYFIETCHLFNKQYPEMHDKIGIVAVGKEADALSDLFPYPVYSQGYISDVQIMVNVYNACDVFFMPSLQENLPNTIAEAMACGVPCIASKVGGIPQMIHHLENGYLAQPRQAASMVQGLEWFLFQCDKVAVSKAARAFAIAQYSEQNVATKYIEIYNCVCEKGHE